MTALTMYRRPLAATAALLACGLLAGCGSTTTATQTPAGIPSTGQTSTTSSPTATTSSSSTTASGPASSSTNDLTRQAEAVYRQQFALVWASYKTGGIAPGSPAPAAFKELMTGRALSDTMTELGQIESKGIHYKSGTSTIRSVAPSDRQMAGSVVALQSCEDGRSLTNQHPDGTVSHGRLINMTSYYTQENGHLKLMYYLGKAVASCDEH